MLKSSPGSSSSPVLPKIRFRLKVYLQIPWKYRLGSTLTIYNLKDPIYSSHVIPGGWLPVLRYQALISSYHRGKSLAWLYPRILSVFQMSYLYFLSYKATGFLINRLHKIFSLHQGNQLLGKSDWEQEVNSAVMTTCCSCREPWFDSWHLHSSSQLQLQ